MQIGTDGSAVRFNDAKTEEPKSAAYASSDCLTMLIDSSQKLSKYIQTSQHPAVVTILA